MIVLPLCLCAVAAALAGCAPSPPDAGATPSMTASATPRPQPTPTATASGAEPSPLQAHLTIWASWGPEGMRGLNARIQQFQTDHPAVEFSLVYYPAEELRSRLEAAGSAELPSIFLAPGSWGPALMAAGRLLDLRPLSSTELQLEFQPLAWRQVSYDGQVLGLPIRMYGRVLYRNRELAAVPAATLLDMLETARGLRGTAAIGAALDYGFETSVSQAEACGGGLLMPAGPPDIGGPAGLCWLNLLQALSGAGEVVFNTDEDLELFASGQAAWWIGSTELHSMLSEALGDQNLAIDPWPIYEQTGGRMAGFVEAENAFLAADLAGDQLGAAWAFTLSLVTPEAQLAFSDPNQGGFIPTQANVAPQDVTVAAMHAAVLNGAPYPLAPELQVYIEILERAARGVSLQGADPETAQRRALEELAQLENGDGG